MAARRSPQTASGAGLPALIALFAAMGFQGFLTAVNTGAAPLLALDFRLDDAGVARVFGWHALGALGTFVLARFADRLGRRRLLIWSVFGAAVASFATALAPGLIGFVLAQVAKEAFAGVLLAASTVVIAEELPLEWRTRGQSWAGILVAVGGGLALVLVAALSAVPGSWRWAWAFAGTGLCVVLVAILRSLRETTHFSRAAALGETRRTRICELLVPRYRRRTVGVLGSWFLAQMTYTVTHSWLIYHPARELSLAPGLITGVVVGAGALGLVGNPIGAWLADRAGRRATVLITGAGTALAGVAFYWVPAGSTLAVVAALCLLFSLASLFDAARTVAYRAATTELFPTRLRGTLQGAVVLVGAVSAVVTQFATAGLASQLGLVPAITLLGLAGLPGYLLFFLWVPETAGLELERASLEQ